jgi:hypothetical protein
MTYRDIIDTEMREASKRFGPYHNGHEVYGVLAEELAEFFDHVRDNTDNGPEAAYELVQLAAVALRYAIENSDVDEVAQVQAKRWGLTDNN